MTDRPTALVLAAGNRPGPSVLRSLRAAGYRVLAADERRGLSGRCRGWSRPIRYTPPTVSRDAFLEDVDGICMREGVDVVIPNDDERALAALVRHLPDPGGAVVAGPTTAQYDALCDKGNLGGSAAAAGLSVIPAVRVALGEPDGPWPALPSVVKPRMSELARAGMKAVVVHSPAERDIALRRLAATAIGAVVEERIVGPQWRVHFATDGERFASIAVLTVREYPPQGGLSSVSEVGLEPPIEVGLVAQRLVASVGYRGVGSVQIILRDHTPFVHDVNLRLPSTAALTIAAGLDTPRLAAEIARGRAVELEQPARRHLRYIWLEAELRNLVSALPRRESIVPARRIAADVARGILRRDCIVDGVDLDDPLPTLAIVERALRRSLRA